MRRSTFDIPGGGTPRLSSRLPGAEVGVLLWALRHPVVVSTPVLLVWAVLTYGWQAVAPVVVAVLLGVTGWWRYHPVSFDRFAAPRLRTVWRRWTAYRGRRWADVLADCDLVREQRGTGRLLVPRLLRVHAITSAVDVLRVRMLRGQDERAWVDRAAPLADALGAHRVSVTRSRPGVLVLVVERRPAFARVLDAPAIPATSAAVDLRGLDIGDTEYGVPFLLRVLGVHLLVAGASGAGKGSWMWGPLRALGALIRDGLVRIRMIDLKGGAETERGAPLFYRYATTPGEAVRLLEEYRDDLVARQALMRERKVRRCHVSWETPFELLVIDELAMLTAYGPREVTRAAIPLLSQVMTQGRAGLFGVWAYVQEPSKDVVEVRDLFTLCICLAVTVASHVDMVLREGARERGALADEIPTDDSHAGIGFYIDPITRRPIRVRAGFTDDADITELVQTCAPTPAVVDGEVIAFPHPTDQEGQAS